MRLPVAVAIFCISLVPAALAGPRERIAGTDAPLCDSERRVCLRGSLVYYSNPRLVELRSRVQKADGPGLLSIHLVGQNANGHTRRTTLEIRIRGKYSEIVNSKLITDHPDVDAWRLESIHFSPGPPTDNDR